MPKKKSNAVRKKTLRLFFPMSMAAVLAFSSAVYAAPAVAPPNYLLLRNKGAFIDPARCFSTVRDPFYLSGKDLDGDEDIDFVVPSKYEPDPSIPGEDLNHYIAVHLSDYGRLSLNKKYIVPAVAEQIYLADVVGDDGIPDILVAHPGEGNGFSILQGNGDGTFAAAVPYLGRGSVTRIIAGDFVPDPPQNRKDIAIGIDPNPAGNTDPWELMILRNDDGAGNFTTITSAGQFSSNILSGIDKADVNGDGRDDLLTTLSGTNQVIVNLSTNSSPYFLSNDVYSVHPTPHDGKFADVNGDGNLDIIVGGVGQTTVNGNDTDYQSDPSNTDNVTFLSGNGDGTFGPSDGSLKRSQTGAYKSRGLVAADFNGDNMIDIATTSPGDDFFPYKGQEVRVLFGDNTGTFDTENPENPLVYEPYWGARGIVAEDVDGDDIRDLVFTVGGNLGSPTFNTICVLRNNMN